MPLIFDVKRLIKDCGGVGRMSRERGFPRATLYRWMKTGSMSSEGLIRIKEVYGINVDRYFKSVKE